jgi:hypothetical protein
MQDHQAAKGLPSNWDALVELLESVEHFLYRVGIYTRIPRTLAMDEMIMKIMVELLGTLALATRELKQARPSTCVLSDALPTLLTATQSNM